MASFFWSERNQTYFFESKEVKHIYRLERATRNENQVRRNLVSIIASYTTVDEIIYFTTGLVINKVI